MSDVDAGSTMQRPIPWALAFVIGSAVVGPAILTPPWGDVHRRQQQLGFAIGVVAWGVGLWLLLTFI